MTAVVIQFRAMTEDAMERGETNLNVLLQTLEPTLHEEHYVFGCLTDTHLIQSGTVKPIATIKEKEGVSVILSQHDAETIGILYDGVFQQITLTVHSSLASVGLTAAISTGLAALNIPANIVAGTFHDHVFVPIHLAEAAMHCLRTLSEEAERRLRDLKPNDTAQA